MVGCIGTNVAASAVLSFIRQQLLGSSSSSGAAAAAAEGADATADPLLMVTDGLLVLLKLIVDIHRNKRPPVVDLLGYACSSSSSNSSNSSSSNSSSSNSSSNNSAISYLSRLTIRF